MSCAGSCAIMLFVSVCMGKLGSPCLHSILRKVMHQHQLTEYRQFHRAQFPFSLTWQHMFVGAILAATSISATAGGGGMRGMATLAGSGARDSTVHIDDSLASAGVGGVAEEALDLLERQQQRQFNGNGNGSSGASICIAVWFVQILIHDDVKSLHRFRIFKPAEKHQLFAPSALLLVIWRLSRPSGAHCNMSHDSTVWRTLTAVHCHASQNPGRGCAGFGDGDGPSLAVQDVLNLLRTGSPLENHPGKWNRRRRMRMTYAQRLFDRLRKMGAPRFTSVPVSVLVQAGI